MKLYFNINNINNNMEYIVHGSKNQNDSNMHFVIVVTDRNVASFQINRSKVSFNLLLLINNIEKST